MGVAETLCTVVLGELKTHSRVIVAVSGPQGSGKTTASRAAAQRLRAEHAVPTVAVSLDDFYRPYAELQAIARRGNPLLQHRGLPGTHDTDLARAFMHAFLEGRPAAVPVYDKSMHAGAGDRTGSIDLPADTRVVLLEGWMVGFRPVGPQQIAATFPQIAAAPISVRPSPADLEEIDANLRAYAALWDACATLVHIKPLSLDFVYKWRLDQEHELVREKGRGMTDEQVRQFVDQYMPAYILYNHTLAGVPAANVVALGADHEVVAQ